jgi:hypothetical protein
VYMCLWAHANDPKLGWAGDTGGYYVIVYVEIHRSGI